MKVKVYTSLAKTMEFKPEDYCLESNTTDAELIDCITTDLEDDPDRAIEDADVTDITVEKIT